MTVMNGSMRNVINGAAGSASELKAGDTVTLQKDGDTITSIIAGTQVHYLKIFNLFPII